MSALISTDLLTLHDALALARRLRLQLVSNGKKSALAPTAPAGWHPIHAATGPILRRAKA